MKNIIFGGAGIAIIVIVSAILLSVTGRGTRSHELNLAVARAVKNTVQAGYERACEEGNSKALTEEMTAYLGQAVLQSVHSEASVEIDILEMDPEKGVVSAKVTEKFTYPNGKKGQVSVRKTAIADRQAPEEANNYIIRYYVNDWLYKEYSICKGDPMIEPKAPVMPGKQFKGWINKANQTKKPDTEMEVDKNYDFEAVFE
ncbi:MAG: hypothetical protein HFG80_00070 [Eubacterium sp.]|nr:hypothetical protein [Eubacterium sp.]